MRPSVLTAQALGAALIRMVFFAAVIGGVAAMHALGHMATHHEDVPVPASVIASEPAAGSTTVGMGRDAGSMHGNAGSAGSDMDGAGHCRGGHAPGCPEHEFDFASVCVAVLTAAVALMVELLHAWPTSCAATVPRPSLTGVAGRGSGLPPPRTPSLAQLAVLRI